MRRPSTSLPEPALGIAALIGGMLGVLLCAVLGWISTGRAQRRGDLDGTVTPVLAARDAITLDLDPIVEWQCVPAPWRAGQLLPRRHAHAMSRALPCRFMRAWVAVRGPPAVSVIA